MRLLRNSDALRSRWKNDGGWTTVLASDPPLDIENASQGQFRWRVSIAEIEQDGAFSIFPGVDRELLLLAGKGIELDFSGDGTLTLQQRFQSARFRGEDDVYCRLLAGPTQDFNVMARRDVQAQTMARPLNGCMVIFAEHGSEWLIHQLAGSASLRDADSQLSLQRGESVYIDARERSRARMQLEGSGEVILIRFQSADAAAPAAGLRLCVD